jgi:hypothetical protein
VILGASSLTAQQEQELIAMLHGRIETIVPRALALVKRLVRVMEEEEDRPDSGDVRLFAVLMMVRAQERAASVAFENAAPGPANGREVVQTMRAVFESAIDQLERGAWPEPRIVVVTR